MKLRIEKDISKLDLRDRTLSEYYTEGFSKPILFNKKHGVIYYDVEAESIPIEGQKISCRFGICVVTYSCMNLDEYSEEDFYSISLITVREE